MSKSKYSILGMLIIEPMSGYDMKKFSEAALGHFWHESYGNLYPRLRQLAAEGMVVATAEERAGGPNAKVYSLTERGRSEFLEWLAGPVTEEPVRSELLLKVFFGSQAPPELTERQIRNYQIRQQKLQQTFGLIESHLRAEAVWNPNQPFWLMTLRRGQLHVESRLQWCEESLAVLRSMRSPQLAASPSWDTTTP